MNTLPLRLNGFEFEGCPPGSLLVARVDSRPGASGDWALYITLRRPPSGAVRGGGYPTAFYPVPAPDLVYTFPEEEEAPTVLEVGPATSRPPGPSRLRSGPDPAPCGRYNNPVDSPRSLLSLRVSPPPRRGRPGSSPPPSSPPSDRPSRPPTPTPCPVAPQAV